jgi:hypothetical protein
MQFDLLYDNFDWWRTRHDLGFEPSLIWTPTTVTPLRCWLSTTYNAIDLAEKAFLQASQENKNEMNAI